MTELENNLSARDPSLITKIQIKIFINFSKTKMEKNEKAIRNRKFLSHSLIIRKIIKNYSESNY